jgi:hypothetical protein
MNTKSRNSSFPLQLEEDSPLLFYPQTGPKNFTAVTKNGTWVDVVFDVTNAIQPPHPIHKHFNKMELHLRGPSSKAYA